MKHTHFYVCPTCGNLITALEEASVSCCGKKLTAARPQKADEAHRVCVEHVETEWGLQLRMPAVHGTLLWHCTEHGLFYQNV